MEELFEKLSTYKGQELKCKYLSGKSIIPLDGILKDVDYYKGITLGAVILPFIAMASGIIEIRTLDDEILYLNENMTVENHCKTPEELEAKKKELFGDDYEEKKKAYSLKKHTVKPNSVN